MGPGAPAPRRYESLADYVVGNAEAGSVVLFHPTLEHTEQMIVALPLIHSRLVHRGFRFVTLAQITEEKVKEHL
ncbi:hypothetical protein [Microbulbifer spongiae]|uniref:Polysaccharide deacetylase n=1 Tax=Microbulbifer spongiae TaxID=2944933 RepID=A0ABY9E5T6_9GAMM|nr:hypothetical protein [Microbulbifer sp. MI-G]WKD48383.1 hypothetical protein M8T91_10595 [Microbulbifer sp. MI-G]